VLPSADQIESDLKLEGAPMEFPDGAVPRET
jgi:hypothetical protein